MPQRQLVSFDWAIKRLLRSKANFGILEGFLSELLHDDIKILEILDGESNQDRKDSKFNRVDIKVRNQHEEIVIIEVQFEQELDYLQRILFGTSKVIVEHMKQSASYETVSKVISVNILYFDLGRGDDYIYRGSTRFTGLHTGHELELNAKQQAAFNKTGADQIFPEYYLIKVNQFDNVAKDTLDEWIYFLKNETIEDSFRAKGLKQAKEQLDVLKLSEEARRDYDTYLEDRRYQASMFNSSYGSGHMDGEKKGWEKGMEKGREEGREEGRKEGQQKLLTEQATAKYGTLPSWAEEKLRNASAQQLQTWSKTIFKAESLNTWLKS
jgi:predicted transposase/invertase (TIGR01784 family)